MSRPDSLGAMIVTLTLTGVLAGALLGGVKRLTDGPIAVAADRSTLQAVEAVLPEFDNNPAAEAVRIAVAEGDTLTLYPATLGGKPAGAAVMTHSPRGFSGEIEVMAGFDAEGRISGYSVLSHSETPGLGARMTTWFADTTGSRSVIGLPCAAQTPALKADGGEVDAITGATITSRAFMDALERARQAYVTYTSTIPQT